MRILPALLLLATAAAGQSQTALPGYFLGAGASWRARAGTTGWLTSAVQVGGASGRTYSITTLDLAPAASLRTGAAWLLAAPGNFRLLTHIDGGITATSTQALASFSGGGMVLYQLPLPHRRGVYAVGVVRMVAVGTAVRPVFEFGIGRGF